jgi:hypothetical protein
MEYRVCAVGGMTTQDRYSLKNSAISACFFGALLVLGLLIFRDYGVSLDEECSRLQNGLVNYRYVLHGDKALCECSEKYHGPAFEFVLIVLERRLGLKDTRSIYLMRHLVTFLVFYLSVLAFYWLLKERFEDRRVALIGCLFLVLSPRIFAEAFYNSKDLAFLSFYTFSLATLWWFLRTQTIGTALAHGLSCGFLIGVRILGIFVPLITLILASAKVLAMWRSGERFGAMARNLLVYNLGLVFFTILFWPILWEGPLHHFRAAFKEMRLFPWNGTVLYMGEFVPAPQLPWHYIPVWLAITTPILYSVLFALGLGRIGLAVLRRPLRLMTESPMDTAFLASVLLPVLIVILLQSVVYDGWRHLYFIYPSFLFFSVVGFVTLWDTFRGLGAWARPLSGGALVLGAVFLGQTAWTMVRYHPFENVFFSAMAGRSLSEIRQYYEMDYWGLSVRRALEELLEKDPSPEVRVQSGWYVDGNAQILTRRQRSRLHLTDSQKAQYFVHTYRWHPQDFPLDHEAHSIQVDGAKICVVQRMR